MSQSIARILVHFVFSTKHRERWIADSEREDLHAYIGGIVDNLSGTLLAAGSVEDHIHLLLAHPRTATLAEVVEAMKTGSSKWIKTRGTEVSRVSLAERLRRVFDQSVARASVGAIFRQPAGAS